MKYIIKSFFETPSNTGNKLLIFVSPVMMVANERSRHFCYFGISIMFLCPLEQEDSVLYSLMLLVFCCSNWVLSTHALKPRALPLLREQCQVTFTSSAFFSFLLFLLCLEASRSPQLWHSAEVHTTHFILSYMATLQNNTYTTGQLLKTEHRRYWAQIISYYFDICGVPLLPFLPGHFCPRLDHMFIALCLISSL